MALGSSKIHYLCKKHAQMKIAFYSRPEIFHEAEELSTFFELLDRYPLAYSVNAGFAEVIAAQTGRKVPVYAAAPPRGIEQEIPHSLWNLKVHYHIAEYPPGAGVGNQLRAVGIPGQRVEGGHL